MASSSEITARIPSVSDLFVECGAFAGAIYGNKGMTYHRRVSPTSAEYLYVVNGMIVRHYATNWNGSQVIEYDERTGLVGRWAFRAGLKVVYGFTLTHSDNADNYIRETIIG